MSKYKNCQAALWGILLLFSAGIPSGQAGKNSEGASSSAAEVVEPAMRRFPLSLTIENKTDIPLHIMTVNFNLTRASVGSPPLTEVGSRPITGVGRNYYPEKPLLSPNASLMVPEDWVYPRFREIWERELDSRLVMIVSLRNAQLGDHTIGCAINEGNTTVDLTWNEARQLTLLPRN